MMDALSEDLGKIIISFKKQTGVSLRKNSVEEFDESLTWATLAHTRQDPQLRFCNHYFF